MGAIKKDSRYQVLRSQRNFLGAHLIIQKILDHPGEFVNLFACARETFAVVEDLLLAQGRVVGPLARYADEWKMMGSAFGACLANVGV